MTFTKAKPARKELHVHIPQWLYERLQQACEEDDVTITCYVKSVLNYHLKHR